MKSKMSKKQQLTLEEIERRYVGELVLVEGTVWDEQGDPTKGVVRQCWRPCHTGYTQMKEDQ